MVSKQKIFMGLKEYGRDRDWLDAELGNLRKTHPNKYIAVNKLKIVASDSDLQNLLRKLKTRKLNPRDIPVEFIYEKPPRLIL